MKNKLGFIFKIAAKILTKIFEPGFITLEKLKPFLHFVLYLFFVLVLSTAIHYFKPDQAAEEIIIGLFLLISGVWGLIARSVLFILPVDNRFYKAANTVLILVGAYILFQYLAGVILPAR
jgi:hypothetical protein